MQSESAILDYNEGNALRNGDKEMNQRIAASHIRAMRSTKAGALWASDGSKDLPGSKLEGRWKARYEADQRYIAYTVYSYDTPIAYLGYNGWVILGQKHSVTTSRHQNIVRRALVGRDVTEV